jgi:hypothetical protein
LTNFHLKTKFEVVLIVALIEVGVTLYCIVSSSWFPAYRAKWYEIEKKAAAGIPYKLFSEKIR